MKKLHYLPLCGVLLHLLPGLSCNAAEQTTPALPSLSFSTQAEGKRLLTARDAFVMRLSAFDRAARLKTDKPASEEQFLQFVAQNVLAWEAAEKTQIEAVYQNLQKGLKAFPLTFPKTIHLIKTTGLEEGAAAYTRADAIILPKQKLAKEVSANLLAHELFHVLSRHNPRLRDRLYAAIGFQKCGEIPFPASLASEKITNPDAPVNEHAIRLETNGEKAWMVPILFSRTPVYDVSQGGEFFNYLELRFLVVSKEDSVESIGKAYNPQSPVLLKQDQVSGFFEQIGRNTQYTIHPEEIIADNFMLLVTGKQEIASPEIQNRIKAILLDSNAAR